MKSNFKEVKRSGALRDRLTVGESLNQGEYLKSSQYEYYATLQTDGNFVVYVSSHFSWKNALWASGTWQSTAQRPFRLTMQADGNLVIYDAYNRAVWASKTDFKGSIGHKLVMQSDGNLVLYDGRYNATWATGTWR